MTFNAKRYIISSMVTIASAVLTYFAVCIENGWGLEWTNAILIGLVGAAIRAFIKVLGELNVSAFNNLRK